MHAARQSRNQFLHELNGLNGLNDLNKLIKENGAEISLSVQWSMGALR
jgi:hypothetical protein